MERKLAHVEEIVDIQPIDGADEIETVTILGWHCVVAKKDNFKIGDKIIYIEIDSIVPDILQFEFLRDRKFRVKTIKLRGQISQGLVMPTSMISVDSGKFGIGQDVTEQLGINKYLSPSEQSELQRQEEKIKFEKNKIKKFMMRYSWFRSIFLSRTKKEGFPCWVKKTDEERIQNIPHVLRQFANYDVYVTEKIDYQSGTWTSKEVPKFQGLLGKLLLLKKVIFVVASKNLTNNNKDSLYWQIAKKYNLEEICKLQPGIIIQGEQGSTKIQGNKYELKEPKMWIFNIKNPRTGKYIDYEGMKTFCRLQKLNLVPLIYKGKLSELGSTINELVKYSEGMSVINPKIQREGIVVRCIQNGQKLLSFKVINPKFLLKYED